MTENNLSFTLPKKLNNKKKSIILSAIKKIKNTINNENEIEAILLTENLKSFISSLSSKDRVQNSLRSSILPKHDSFDKLSFKSTGSILKLLTGRYDATKYHEVPKHQLGQWVGVEIECFIPLDDFGNDSSDLNRFLKREILNRKIKYVRLQSDGSIECSDDYQAMEITIITNINDMSNLKKLCELLKEIKADVNRTCGLHVHLDQRDATTKIVGNRAYRLNNSIELLAKMVPASRRKNTYCKLEKTTMSTSDRYYAINTTAYEKYNTLEVRLHSGSTDYVKISNWIKLLYGISRSELIKRSDNYVVDSLESLIRLVPLELEVYNYVDARVRKFQGETQTTLTDMIIQNENEDVDYYGDDDSEDHHEYDDEETPF